VRHANREIGVPGRPLMTCIFRWVDISGSF
jgi:hypothetical protein